MALVIIIFMNTFGNVIISKFQIKFLLLISIENEDNLILKNIYNI